MRSVVQSYVAVAIVGAAHSIRSAADPLGAARVVLEAALHAAMVWEAR